MSRPTLRKPEQSWPVWMGLWLFEFAASLKLAVILISAAAVVLGWATFVEAQYGAAAVRFGVYGSWWFASLCGLLALNIFCAAAIRYPWKRHQTGFVITHIGLLTLLFGCLVQRQRGIDAQAQIFEGEVASTAYESNQFFEVTRAKPTGPAEVIRIPFEAGPFNWQDLDQMFFFPWKLAVRDAGVLYDSGGVRLEVLDYYSNSRLVRAPHVELKLGVPARPKGQPSAPGMPAGEMMQPLELSIRPSELPWHQKHGLGLGERRRAGGGDVDFWMTSSAGETAAFTNSAPAAVGDDPLRPLGKLGVVVLGSRGKKAQLPVDQLAPGKRRSLSELGIEIELVKHFERAEIVAPQAAHADSFDLVERDPAAAPQGHGDTPSPAVELLVHRGDKSRRLVLFADMPELNLQDYDGELFGAYWHDFGALTSAERMAGAGRSRIDVLYGADQKLYYRKWQILSAPDGKRRTASVVAGPLPHDGRPVDAFQMPFARLQLSVTELVPSRKPELKVRPLPFDSRHSALSSFRAGRVRLTVDGHSDEFWVVGPPANERSPLENHVVQAGAQSVHVRMPLYEVPLNFGVRLLDFERRLDPGTSQPSHYSSWVDFVEKDRHDKKYNRDRVWITMNAPVNFEDPENGRSYRLYQEGFGPQDTQWRPGDAEYEQRVAQNEIKDTLYYSVLTVNYDPGRGVKYIGCLLVVAGIGTMFYMRAYFFKPRGPKPSAAARRRS